MAGNRLAGNINGFALDAFLVMQHQELDLAEYSGALRRAVPKMLLAGIFFAGLAVGATYVIKPAWEVETSLLMASQDQASSSALNALIGRKDAKPLAILKGILRSRTSMERVAKQLNVDREKLEDAVKVATVDDENQLTITVRWKQKEQAKQIAQAFLDTLSSMRKEIGFTVANRQSKLIEEAIIKKSKELDAAEKVATDYQKSMKAPVDPTAPGSVAELVKQKKQLESDVESLGIQIGEAKKAAQRLGLSVELPSGLPNAQEWQAKLSKAEYDLRISQIKFGPAAPVVVNLKKELEITRQQLQKEILKYISAVSQNVDANIAMLQAQRIVAEWRLKAVSSMAAAAPDEARELSRRLRDVASLTAVVVGLRQQYELKKIEEIGDVSWSVLEEPFYTQEDPINKQFVRNGFLGFVVGALLMGALVGLGQRRRSFSAGV